MHRTHKNEHGKRIKPARNVHAEVPYEYGEVEHPPWYICLLSLLQGRILSKHVPGLNYPKEFIAKIMTTKK